MHSPARITRDTRKSSKCYLGPFDEHRGYTDGHPSTIHSILLPEHHCLYSHQTSPHSHPTKLNSYASRPLFHVAICALQPATSIDISRLRISVDSSLMSSLQMWWLDLEPERLLAIYCQEGQATEEPFHSAFCYLEDQLKLEGPLGEALEFDWSEDVQSEQCSDLKKGVMACIPDKVAHQVVITTWKGLAAVGIGFHWQGCLKAAYLALATTAAIKFQSVDDVQCLVEQSNHAKVLKPISSAEIYTFELSQKSGHRLRKTVTPRKQSWASSFSARFQCRA